MSLRLVVQSQDAKAAQDLHDWITRAFKTLGENKEVKGNVPGFESLAGLLMPKVEGSRLVLALKQEQIAAVLLPAVQKVREAAGRTQSANNLKQMALAMHNLHDATKRFPTHAIYDKNGKPLLSWRVQILPYIEEGPLYNQFHLDEPWDSEHNRKLIPKMPKIYASPLSALNNEHKTTYLLPVGKETAFPPGPEGIRIADITDGTSNTILIVEAADSNAVIWSKPSDLKVSAKEPLTGIRDRHRKTFNTAFADGSVRAIAMTIEPQMLWALFTRNGGEVIGEIP
jgi:prepilin-type processing-associated H-X9-DG protein